MIRNSTFKNIKKALLIIVCIASLLTAVSCFPSDTVLKTKMAKYYEDDSNYCDLSGVVSYMSVHEDGSLRLEIRVQENNDTYGLKPNAESMFMLPSWQSFAEQLEAELSVGDYITITSAPDYFYNGHNRPVARIEKDDKELLSFEDGKNAYLRWVYDF